MYYYSLHRDWQKEFLTCYFWNCWGLWVSLDGNWLKGYKNKLRALLNCQHLNVASLGVLNTASTMSVTEKWLQVLISWFLQRWIMYNGSWVNFDVDHWVMGHNQWPIACAEFGRSRPRGVPVCAVSNLCPVHFSSTERLYGLLTSFSKQRNSSR